jgi:hypothetical protein
VPFEGTEEERKAKAEALMDEYYGLDHEDMVRTVSSFTIFQPVLYLLG